MGNSSSSRKTFRPVSRQNDNTSFHEKSLKFNFRPKNTNGGKMILFPGCVPVAGAFSAVPGVGIKMNSLMNASSVFDNFPPKIQIALVSAAIWYS